MQVLDGTTTTAGMTGLTKHVLVVPWICLHLGQGGPIIWTSDEVEQEPGVDIVVTKEFFGERL